MVQTKVAVEPTVDDTSSYVTAVNEALHDDPAKFKDFLDLLYDVKARRVDEASLFARAGKLFEDHPNLLAGLNAFLPAEAKILTPPEPEQTTELPDNNDRKRDGAEDLLNKIKTRFQKLDTHVPKLYVKIMEDFKEGKKWEEDVREEVIDLLYYHEDLIDEFLRLLQ